MQGTSLQSIADVVEDLFGIKENELTTEDIAAIEEIVFECSLCGCWCDGNKEEIDNEVVCSSCASDGIEDEEDVGDDEDYSWCDGCDNAVEDCECEH